LRSSALSLAKACLIGLRSGEYGGNRAAGHPWPQWLLVRLRPYVILSCPSRRCRLGPLFSPAQFLTTCLVNRSSVVLINTGRGTAIPVHALIATGKIVAVNVNELSRYTYGKRDGAKFGNNINRPDAPESGASSADAPPADLLIPRSLTSQDYAADRRRSP
jgi:hypothetical protein